MKKLLTSFLLLMYCLLSSQYIMNLEASQNGANQIKVHLKVYLPNDGEYLSYNTNINQNTIILNVCYYTNDAGAVYYPENDFYIDIPSNGSYTLKVNQYISGNITTCNYTILEDTATLNFTTPIQGTVSLGTAETKANGLQIFPNPVKDILNLKSSEKFEKLSINDTSGKILLNILNPGNKLDVSNLSNGIYLIELSNGKGKYRKKLTINR